MIRPERRPENDTFSHTKQRMPTNVQNNSIVKQAVERFDLARAVVSHWSKNDMRFYNTGVVRQRVEADDGKSYRRTNSFTSFTRGPTFVYRKMRWSWERGSKQRLFQNRPADRVAMHTQSQLTGRRCDRRTGREGIAVMKAHPTWSRERPVTRGHSLVRGERRVHASLCMQITTRPRKTVEGIEELIDA